jgi:hypothetical protein
MPRLAAAERHTRDGLVLRMFLAGMSYRDIARNPRVRLSAQGVHNVVTRMMAQGARRRGLLSDEAFSVHVERTETLLAANWHKAVSGDLRAGELCRRILDQQARLYGLNTGAGERLAPEELDDDSDIGEDGLDDLERYRLRSQRAARRLG